MYNSIAVSHPAPQRLLCNIRHAGAVDLVDHLFLAAMPQRLLIVTNRD